VPSPPSTHFVVSELLWFGTMTSENSGSEDVNDFLQRIKELGDRRDQEDEERNRKLEEEILQGRKERQARRSGLLLLSV
jgi:hypothetical protein